MTSQERRLRRRAELRAGILEAALQIVAEQGLGALSIRAVAERVEYSAAAIYLHFESKEALLREVAREGFRRMHEAVGQALAACGEQAEPQALLRALARSYLDFALEHTAHFRVMFDAPAVPSVRSGRNGDWLVGEAAQGETAAGALRRFGLLQQIASAEPCRPECTEGARLPLVALATIHGLVSLFLSGRLSDVARTPDELLALVDECVAVYAGSGGVGKGSRPVAGPGTVVEQ